MAGRARILLICMTLLLGCPAPERVPRFVPALEPFDATSPGWYSTRPVLIVADSQLHNLYSEALPERNLSSKALANTAIRPPQLDLFAPDVLRWIVTEGAHGAEAVIHLGDGIDVGCTGEMRSFLEVMQQGGKPWLMAAGNHDFFYLGSTDVDRPGLWEKACRDAGDPLPKDRFIRVYVAALVQQRGPGFDDLARSLGLVEVRDDDLFALADRIPDDYRFEGPKGSDAVLQAIAWHIDTKHPYRSFVLQRADLTGEWRKAGVSVKAIIFDSCQYGRRPVWLPNAWKSYPLHLNPGATGEVLADQLRLIREWIDADHDQKVAYVLMSHYPFDEIAGKSRSSLGWLWANRRIPMYFSAHTHKGFYAHHFLTDDLDGLELNVGSVVDWPMEWRTLVAHGKTAEELYIESKHFRLVDALRNRQGYFLRGWEVPIGAPDDYRLYTIGEASGGTLADFYLLYHLVPPLFGQYQATASGAARDTEIQVKNTLLWTYARLIDQFPTDPGAGDVRWPAHCTSDADVRAQIEHAAGAAVPLHEKVDLLIELDAFETTRHSYDPASGALTDEARMRFKLSQAVWASRYETTHGRKLQAEDELVRVRVRK